MKVLMFFIFILPFTAALQAFDSMQIMSNAPRIYYFTNFLSPLECDHIIHLARPHLKRSTVLDDKGGKVDYRRTSEGMFFPSNPDDEVLRAVEVKIAELVRLPVQNGEGFQVLCYQKGGEYQPHYDYFNPAHPGGAAALERGGQRVATMIIYLNTPQKGGETIFPLADISVQPKKGAAVLFYNMLPSEVEDPNSLHGGAPVVEGEKWIMTKWMRQGEFK